MKRVPIITLIGLAGLIVSSQVFSQDNQQASSTQRSVTVTPVNNAPPRTLTPQDLLKLEAPPQTAIPIPPISSNLTDPQKRQALECHTMDLLSLYQEAAFNDPVIRVHALIWRPKKNSIGKAYRYYYLRSQLTQRQSGFSSMAREVTEFMISAAIPLR